jgi:hypothetical protein
MRIRTGFSPAVARRLLSAASARFMATAALQTDAAGQSYLKVSLRSDDRHARIEKDEEESKTSHEGSERDAYKEIHDRVPWSRRSGATRSKPGGQKYRSVIHVNLDQRSKAAPHARACQSSGCAMDQKEDPRRCVRRWHFRCRHWTLRLRLAALRAAMKGYSRSLHAIGTAFTSARLSLDGEPPRSMMTNSLTADRGAATGGGILAVFY